MWPWEHLAFGYLLVSLGGRLRDGHAPSEGVVVALAVGTQFPDLVDKPLAWGFGLLPSGISLAHSILFALPVTVAVGLVAARRGHRRAGVAFGVGYLSHIAGDGLYPLAVDGEVGVGYMLWPLVARSDGQGSIPGAVDVYWAAFVQFLATPRGQLYLGLEAAFVLGTVALWLVDGRPGLDWLARLREWAGPAADRDHEPEGSTPDQEHD